MSCCNCGQPERLCRCPKGKGGAPKRAYIAECTDCDPCRPCESMVKICSFVAPTLTEGQRFRNSFIYNQEDDSVYYIDDAGTPTRFGSSPMFIDNFNPDDRPIPRQVVFDFVNSKAYIYNPEGEYITVALAGGGAAKKEITISYGEESWSISANPAGPNIDYDLASRPGYGSRIEMARNYNISFTDTSTGQTIPNAEVFNMLRNGADIVFNNVPIWSDNGSADVPIVTPFDGMKFNVFFEQNGLSVLSGSAFIAQADCVLGIAIVEDTTDELTTYSIIAQGVHSYRAPA